MITPLRKSLRTQFTLWTFLTVSLLATVVLIMSAYRSYSVFLTDYQKALSERMKHTANLLESMIEETDYLGMSRQANSLLLTYGVNGVKVLDANGEPIIIKGDSSGFSIQHTIVKTDKRLGLIQVNFSDTPIRDKIRRLLTDTLVITLIGLPLTALLMWLLSSWKLNDLTRLSNELHQVGNLNSEDINLSGITRQDEIGHLARSLVDRSRTIQEGIEQQQLLVHAIDQSYDSIVLTDDQAIIEYVNPAFSRITGFSHDEAIGENPRILKSGKHPDKFYEQIWKQLTSGNTWKGRIINKRKDGVEYQEEATISPVINSAGSIHHYVAVKRDVTREVILQEQLNQAEKMTAIGLMAGGIAHDLNNILTGIVAYPDLLLMKLPDDSELRILIKTMKESGRRAAEIVADLLTLARGVAASREHTDLNTLVTSYLNSPEHQKLQAIHPHVNFSPMLTPHLHPIVCSPIHIRKSLMNLVINAAEAIEQTGTVLISTRNQLIETSTIPYQTLKKGEYTVLSIKDSGTGIAEQDLDHIFEPFYTKKMMGRSGTGLGLAVVWNTVQDHEGQITVHSNETGTCFDLYFPATQKKRGLTKESQTTEVVRGNGEHILVVDDEKMLRHIAEQMLEQLNYSVDSVSSGEEALEFLKKKKTDLILLDMIMPPGINGQETYEKILEIRPQQKALIVSGFSGSDEIIRSLKLGAGGFVNKPFDMKELSIAVNEELSRQKE